MTPATFVTFIASLSQLGMLVSVAFVVRQMHLSSRHQQATIRHGRVQQLQMICQQASQAEFAEVFTRGLAGDASMEARDCNRFIWFTAAIFNMFEDMFDQHRDHIVDKQSFASAVVSMRAQLAMPGARAAWKVIRGRYTKDFVDYVDRLVVGTSPDGIADVSTAWRQFITTTDERTQR